MDDQFDDEPVQTVSFQEYLEGVEEQELEADLVLGGDEGKECTYANGYMKRQAIFSCLTCTPEGNAGVCTACSLACHDGHEIVELWTKRNFRCDCGNSKFGEFFCRLLPSKDVENEKNSYNHNFKGLYCTCAQPFPDPNVEEQLEMIQCCICEDWFHEEHLDMESSIEIPRNEEGEPCYEDFICGACSPVFSFLTLYPQTVLATGKLTNQEVVNLKGKDVLEVEPLGSKEEPVLADKDGIGATCMEGVKVKLDPGASSSGTCIIGVDLHSTSSNLEKHKPIFLSKSWRDVLCRCEKCREFYTREHILYLLEKEDSIVEYEKMAKEKRAEREGNELSLLNKLGHVEKMEILSGIADMKNEFISFMETIDSSKPVTTADVHQLFENLAKKRRRLD
uniref:UBR-type domain-containing protein n=1 Tax=Kalanchoe fedtschenkoi TaxID=63787 RepID=A0A7N0UMG2_KALFE